MTALAAGVLLGLVGGLIFGTLLTGFGDSLLLTVGAAALGGAASAWVWPTPFLTFAGIVLSIIGIEI